MHHHTACIYLALSPGSRQGAEQNEAREPGIHCTAVSLVPLKFRGFRLFPVFSPCHERQLTYAACQTRIWRLLLHDHWPPPQAEVSFEDCIAFVKLGVPKHKLKKEQQLRLLLFTQYIHAGKDSFVWLTTGFGKSLL